MATILAGAQGFLLKEVSSEELLKAVRTVATGHSILDPVVTQRVLARVQAQVRESGEPKSEGLSPQEQRVLALVAEGKTNKEIAASLTLSDKTVEHYLSNVFQKLTSHAGRRLRPITRRAPIWLVSCHNTTRMNRGMYP